MVEPRDTVIREEDLNPDFLEELSELVEPVFEEEEVLSVQACYQCGTCTGSCPSGRRTSYRTRLIMRKLQLGLVDEVIKSDELWMCTTCYTCYERCPRGVKIVDAVKAARNLAAKEGHMAKAHRMVAMFVIKTGHAVPINDEIREVRKNIGLDEVPPTTHRYEEALEEVQKLVKINEFDKLIGYDWEEGDLVD
ncbi:MULTISPECIES: CoB--CoM heterodisulfide reductase subunit C [unclassified Methanopyrus]|uniref:CoB--CoM heterodisulfide reductase subunit C n=1 Tax=unclassified Methanopyrus TaxID=2684913 RepID=UPI000B4ACCEE|nr:MULTISPECIES: CoB--CoM heterodisulfide reductase subunit C [unclassified Methanopyrus]